MISKLIEIRDEGTFIPALAIKLSAKDGPLARVVGYGAPCVLFGRLDGGTFQNDAYEWTGRTWPVAHKYVEEHFDELEDGAVVDVSFILGETTAPKTSDVAGY